MIPLLAATTTVLAFAASTERPVSPARELWVRFGREFPNLLLEEELGLTTQIQEVLGHEKSIQALSRIARAEQIERMMDWIENWFVQGSTWMRLFDDERLPVSVIRYFADSKYMEYVNFAEYIAKNDNTPVDILIKLSKHSFYIVRMAVASNQNTPVDILDRYSRYKDRDVRRCVGKNPSTSTSILERMLIDFEKYDPNTRYEDYHYVCVPILDQLERRGVLKK